MRMMNKVTLTKNNGKLMTIEEWINGIKPNKKIVKMIKLLIKNSKKKQKQIGDKQWQKFK